MKAQLLNAFEIAGLDAILSKDFSPIMKYGATADDNLLNVFHKVTTIPEKAKEVNANILRGVGRSRGGYVIFELQSWEGDSLYYSVQEYQVVNHESNCWEWQPLKFLKNETPEGGDFETAGEIEDSIEI